MKNLQVDGKTHQRIKVLAVRLSMRLTDFTAAALNEYADKLDSVVKEEQDDLEAEVDRRMEESRESLEENAIKFKMTTEQFEKLWEQKRNKIRGEVTAERNART